MGRGLRFQPSHYPSLTLKDCNLRLRMIRSLNQNSSDAILIPLAEASPHPQPLNTTVRGTALRTPPLGTPGRFHALLCSLSTPLRVAHPFRPNSGRPQNCVAPFCERPTKFGRSPGFVGRAPGARHVRGSVRGLGPRSVRPVSAFASRFLVFERARVHVSALRGTSFYVRTFFWTS